ncbi:hypothetical protein SLEP1_g6304 [Rubroshorea leprosula]|uniref:Uncharacterized protein n=1 Tax=Rubroshorea leprosula TaxID=152421 RepID=A0AAV5I0L9_9ROSI|nr:hypothetical protein SLEP1_g6304 [Rubroshorea leprosula]
MVGTMTNRLRLMEEIWDVWPTEITGIVGFRGEMLSGHGLDC